MGSGVVGLRHEIVLVYAQLNPGLQVPADSVDSIESSSDANCVSSPMALARSWSIEVPARRSEPVVNFGGMPVRKRVLARACTPGSSPGFSAGGLLFIPVKTAMWSRNGSSGSRMGVNSNPAPSVAGVHLFMIMPFGT